MERSKIKQIRDTDKEVLMAAKSEKIEMTLNTENSVATGLLTQRLTELYDDPVQASVRETVSNAIDAVMISHSGDRPEVHIQSPTQFSPILKVKDNGVGMTYEDLKNTYAKYGASTKMEDLSQIGAYGLGAKAPLAYGSEFTVTSVKDGIKTIIIVVREEISNYIKVIDSRESDEPTGTTVAIPVTARDVSRFESNIDEYKNSPIDQDVDLYIDGELCDNSDYAVVTEVPIHIEKTDNGDVVTYGKVWIRKDGLHEYLTVVNPETIVRNMKFVIGGWPYNIPTSRVVRYSSVSANIFIELKAGIVGFSSSRDSITENERYLEFEKLVTSSLTKDSFGDAIVDKINELPLKDFANVIAKVLYSYNAHINFNTWDLQSSNPNTYYQKNLLKINMLDFIHKETGFSLRTIIDATEDMKAIASYYENKPSYSSVSNHAVEYNNGYISSYSSTIAAINNLIDDVVAGKKDRMEMSTALVDLIRASKYNEDEKQGIMLIANVDTGADSDHIRKLKAGRKTLIRTMFDKDLDEVGTYRGHIILTEEDLSSLEGPVEDMKKFGIEIKSMTADDAIERVAEYKRNNRKASATAKRQDLTTRLRAIGQSHIQLDEIDKKAKNVFVLTKEDGMSSVLKKHSNWYSNTTGLNEEDFNIYLSVGMHSARDLELLSELGELYVSEDSEPVGRSKKYEEVAKNVMRSHSMLNEDLNKALALTYVALNDGAHNGYYADVQVKKNVELFIETAEAANIEINKDHIVRVVNIVTKSIEKLTSDDLYSRYKMRGTEYDQFADLLTDDEKQATKAISTFMGGSGRYVSSMVNLQVNYPEAIEQFKEDNENDIQKAMYRAVVKEYIKWIDKAFSFINL